MRAPPENESPAPLGSGNGALGTNDRLAGSTKRKLKPSHSPAQAIVTVIPNGRRWIIKILRGEAVELLPAIFGSRLEALGAGVLLARQCGAKVVA